MVISCGLFCRQIWEKGQYVAIAMHTSYKARQVSRGMYSIADPQEITCMKTRWFWILFDPYPLSVTLTGSNDPGLQKRHIHIIIDPNNVYFQCTHTHTPFTILGLVRFLFFKDASYIHQCCIYLNRRQ